MYLGIMQDHYSDFSCVWVKGSMEERKRMVNTKDPLLEHKKGPEARRYTNSSGSPFHKIAVMRHSLK